MKAIKCRFYDDGCGNGSYIPGSHCGPPSCNANVKSGVIPKCNGVISQCEIPDIRKLRLKVLIKQAKDEINYK